MNSVHSQTHYGMTHFRPLSRHMPEGGSTNISGTLNEKKGHKGNNIHKKDPYYPVLFLVLSRVKGKTKTIYPLHFDYFTGSQDLSGTPLIRTQFPSCQCFNGISERTICDDTSLILARDSSNNPTDYLILTTFSVQKSRPSVKLADLEEASK